MEEYDDSKKEIKEWSPLLEEIKKKEDDILTLENRINYLDKEIANLEHKKNNMEKELEEALKADKTGREDEYELYIDHLNASLGLIKMEIEGSKNLQDVFKEDIETDKEWIIQLKEKDLLEKIDFKSFQGPSDKMH